MAEYDDNNVYAKNLKSETIHISEAISGRKGYYCLGCTREMQAVISKIQYRASYFRHDAIAVKGQPKCTYSDETYRHRLAKEILAKFKSVRVPAIYKYPPPGVDGLAVLIEEAKTVEAHSVGLERICYEDDNGTIQWTSNKLTEEKNLLVRPDVTFFDSNNKPVLLIELVATHKLSDEKKSKLKRLGIDVIQIKIPKDSPAEIERCLLAGEKIKWVYSHVEQRTDYLPVSEGDSTGVPSIDEEQRKLFEENFYCRRAQISNLIRTITKCVESKPYRELEQSFGAELSRVAGNSREHRERLDKLREDIQGSVDSQFETQRRRIEDEERELENEETDFQRYCTELEGRYKSKKRELEQQNELLITSDSEKLYAVERLRIDLDERRKGNGETQQRIRSEIDAADAGSRNLRTELGTLPGRFEQHRTATIRKFEQRRVATLRRFEQLKRTENEAIERIKGEERDRPGAIKEEEGAIEREFEELRKQSDQIITSRDSTGNSELPRRIKNILQTREILSNYPQVYNAYKRARTAWDSFNSGAYENWI
jgi:hypothetical protein